MRKLMARGLAVVSVAVLSVLLFVCCSRHKPVSPPVSQAAQVPACPGSTWGSGATTNDGPVLGGCEPQGCGLNGAWLGQQVNFRELHLNGGANKQGLRIAAFTSSNGDSLAMKVEGDVLSGTETKPNSSKELKGSELDGSTILLRSTLGGTYTLTIQKVIEDGSFWTACNAPGGCANAPKTHLYQFSATDGQGSCVEICKPGMGDEYNTLNGTAVIFKGDLYNDDYTVKSVDGSGASGIPANDDTFNIACVGTSLSKLYFLHHTYASKDPSSPTTVPQRQTLLRLLAGDYCGNGQSFTKEGHAIDLDFNQTGVRPNAEVGLGADAVSVDAMWNSDGTGASCIGTPRLSDVPNSVPADFNGTLSDYIESQCPAKQIGPCGSEQLNAAKNGDFGGNYAISANTFP